jgi:hypothetical protein
MWMHYPTDAAVFSMDDQFLLGSDVLVKVGRCAALCFALRAACTPMRSCKKSRQQRRHTHAHVTHACTHYRGFHVRCWWVPPSPYLTRSRNSRRRRLATTVAFSLLVPSIPSLCLLPPASSLPVLALSPSFLSLLLLLLLLHGAALHFMQPVTSEGQTSSSVYLPAGTLWYDFLSASHAAVRGTGGFVDVASPLEVTPSFQRGGSIVPLKLRVRRCSALMKEDPLTLQVALDEAGQAEGSVYTDDEASFA